MHSFPIFHMIGAGDVFAAVLLIAALILCTAIIVTASLILNKKMRAEIKKEKEENVSGEAESTDTTP